MSQFDLKDFDFLKISSENELIKVIYPIISEAIFCFFNSSKKRTKNFCRIVAPAIWEFRVSMINPKIFLNQKDD